MTGLSDYASKNLLNYITGQIAEPPASFGMADAVHRCRNRCGDGLHRGLGRLFRTRAGCRRAVAVGLVHDILDHPDAGLDRAGLVACARRQRIGRVGLRYHQRFLHRNGLEHFRHHGDTGRRGGACVVRIGGFLDVLGVQQRFGFGAVVDHQWRCDRVPRGVRGLGHGHRLRSVRRRDFRQPAELGFPRQLLLLPFEIPTASSLATVKGHGYASNDPIVFTAEYGGTLPTLSTGTMTGYTVNFVATPATDTINVDTTSGPTTAIVTTSSGSGMVRKIVRQSIPNGVTASFAASALAASAA